MVKMINSLCILPQFLKGKQKCKKTNHAKNYQKKVGFMAKKKKSIARNEEGHSMIKVFIHQEDEAVWYLCVPSTHSFTTCEMKEKA